MSHWNWSLRDGGPGHCFPSGHTAGAMAFVPFEWICAALGWVLLRVMDGVALRRSSALELTTS